MDGFETPPFSLSQDDQHVFVKIECRHTEKLDGSMIQATAIAVEGRIFGFHLEPFYLPLVFPHSVTLASVTVQDTNSIQIVLNKLEPGVSFQNLESLKPQLMPEEQIKMVERDAELGRGLFDSTQTNTQSSSEVTYDDDDGKMTIEQVAKQLLQRAIGKQNFTVDDETNHIHDDDDDDDDQSMDGDVGSNLPLQNNPVTENSGYGCGYRGFHKSSIIPPGSTDVRNLLEIKDPNTIKPEERDLIAEQFEDDKWDEGIYMENYLDQDGEIQYLLKYQPTFQLPPPPSSSATISTSSSSVFDNETTSILIQLLFGYAYDQRTNQGEPTVESGWTLCKLSTSFCCNSISSSSIITTLRTCLRRSLSIPLYRNWSLSIQCVNDIIQFLDLGKDHILNHCLLQIQVTLDQSSADDEIMNLFKDLWINPLVVYLSFTSDEPFHQLSIQIQQILDSATFTKLFVGGSKWDLMGLEVLAKQTLENGQGGFI